MKLGQCLPILRTKSLTSGLFNTFFKKDINSVFMLTGFCGIFSDSFTISTKVLCCRLKARSRKSFWSCFESVIALPIASISGNFSSSPRAEHAVSQPNRASNILKSSSPSLPLTLISYSRSETLIRSIFENILNMPKIVANFVSYLDVLRIF